MSTHSPKLPSLVDLLASHGPLQLELAWGAEKIRVKMYVCACLYLYPSLAHSRKILRLEHATGNGATWIPIFAHFFQTSDRLVGIAIVVACTVPATRVSALMAKM